MHIFLQFSLCPYFFHAVVLLPTFPEYYSLCQVQNQTVFNGVHTVATSSCHKPNSWNDPLFNMGAYTVISDYLSTWTQLTVYPRKAFFEYLDDGMSTSFAALVFGCAALMFLNTFIPKPAFEQTPSQETEYRIRSDLHKEPAPMSAGQESGSNRIESRAADVFIDLNELNSVFGATPRGDQIRPVKQEDAESDEAQLYCNELTSPRNNSSGAGAARGQMRDQTTVASDSHNQQVTSQETDGTQEEIEDLLAEDPELLSSNLKGDLSKFHRLYRFATLKFQPTLSDLKADPDWKLMSRAAEYASLAGHGCLVYQLVLIEQRYGRSSVQVKAFHWLQSSGWFGGETLRRAFACLFIISVFLPHNSRVQHAADVAALLVISIFTVTWAFYEWLELGGRCLRASMWVRIGVIGVTWILVILQEMDIVSLVGFMRPWPLLLTSDALLSTLMVFLICVNDIGAILSFGFFAVCASAIALLVLYQDELDHETGTTMPSFLESFIATFIFMESADNWESLVRAKSNHTNSKPHSNNALVRVTVMTGLTGVQCLLYIQGWSSYLVRHCSLWQLFLGNCHVHFVPSL